MLNQNLSTNEFENLVMGNMKTSCMTATNLDREASDTSLMMLLMEFSEHATRLTWDQAKDALDITDFDFFVGGEYAAGYMNHVLMARDPDGNLYSFENDVHVWDSEFVSRFEKLGCEALLDEGVTLEVESTTLEVESTTLEVESTTLEEILTRDL
ncbi:hypothetical protein QO230_00600 [Vibrio vulnificus]|uniref:hypothetical protein n=1 Tax=Vibrio vulnificus TaxID=672 RepID=UPI0024E0073F|nr:hypothetical protein [Vibrio vulnificus]MDK2606114.1 hypothetical protein [Vibrio vulnificus]MDK2609858.1 hypothetical protein [Vibrio vulnificus]MDK2627356.1 hypothetical protein [Vibrio vulnificus]MDK2702801.1 hypothetical protein [Vibrio vulnificus]